MDSIHTKSKTVEGKGIEEFNANLQEAIAEGWKPQGLQHETKKGLDIWYSQIVTMPSATSLD